MTTSVLDLEAIYAPALESFAGTLVPDALMQGAERSTGLSDWGGEAWSEPAFRERLDVLCRSLEDEAQLTPVGRSRAHSRVHMMLCSRLLMLDWIERHGSLETEILPPFIGSGSGRTGTSFTHQLLSQDPENIFASDALCQMPVPPPGDPAVDARRHAIIDRYLAFQGLYAPEIEGHHPFAPEFSQEDSVLQEGMCGTAPMAFFNIPSFVELVQKADDDAYAWQKAAMQVLQSGPRGRAAKRWALKSPTHIAYMDTLMRTFPHARLYVNHRDPTKVLASHCSMFKVFFRLNSGTDFDPKVIGRFLVQMHRHDLDAMTDWRARHPGVKIVDVPFKDLIADPIAQAERIYASFGEDLSAAARQAMSDFLKVNRHGQGARTRFALDEFGITDRDIEENFGAYMDRYGIVRESAAASAS